MLFTHKATLFASPFDDTFCWWLKFLIWSKKKNISQFYYNLESNVPCRASQLWAPQEEHRGVRCGKRPWSRALELRKGLQVWTRGLMQRTVRAWEWGGHRAGDSQAQGVQGSHNRVTQDSAGGSGQSKTVNMVWKTHHLQYQWQHQMLQH